MRPMIKYIVCKNALSALYFLPLDESSQMGFFVCLFVFGVHLPLLYWPGESFTSYFHLVRPDHSVESSKEELE